MLGKHHQQQYLHKRFKRIQAHMAAFAKQQQQEDLHALRVEIKKVFAFVELIEDCGSKHTFNKPLKPIKHIFKHAGKIRSAQVNLALISAHKYPVPVYAELQRELILLETKRFCVAYHRYLKRMDKSPTMEQVSLHRIEDKCILKQCKKRIGRVDRAINKEFDEAKLHVVRKGIKSLLYTNAMLPKRVGEKLGLNMPYLHQMEEDMGRWHDVVMLRTLLIEGGFTDQAVIGELDQQKAIMLAAIKENGKDLDKKSIHQAK